MPKNFFENRPRYSHYANCIIAGDQVMIVTKEKQGTKRLDDLISGIVVRVLSKGRGCYKNGVKVEILPYQPDWTPEQLYCILKEIKESSNPHQLSIVQQSNLVIGRIQYFVGYGAWRS